MNIEKLHKEFQAILALEERAKNFYDHYIEQIDDSRVKQKLTAIRDDEVRHIEIAKRLIEHVK